jgi:hypothetical protein
VLYGVVSWLILQVSDIAMPALGLPEWSITLVLYFLAIGFPIALIFAWAFELTPDGLKRTKEVDPNASVTPVTGQKINHLIIGLLSVALVFVVIHSYVLEDDGDPGEAPAAAAGGPSSSAEQEAGPTAFRRYEPGQGPGVLHRRHLGGTAQPAGEDPRLQGRRPHVLVCLQGQARRPANHRREARRRDDPRGQRP